MNETDKALVKQSYVENDWDRHLDTAKLIKLIRADEREACAKVCEDGVDTEHPTVKGHIMKNFGSSAHLAKAIRARRET